MRIRRVLAASLVLAIPAAFLYAQTPADRPTKPEAAKKVDKPPEKPVDWGAIFKIHYENRVRSFREQNLVFRNVVLLGDSITEGFEVTRYFPGRRVLNRGIGADVIGNALPADDHRGVLRRLDCSIFDCAATDVFLMIGVNDLNSGRNVDTMEAGYREILRQIKDRAPAVRVHVESLLPTRGASRAAQRADQGVQSPPRADGPGIRVSLPRPALAVHRRRRRAQGRLHQRRPPPDRAGLRGLARGDREDPGLAAEGEVTTLRPSSAQSPSSSRTPVKASMANCRSSRLWAAETCTRTRALPCGTTG